ncbi:hypothetical protein SFA35_07835 [Pseudomonas sp. HR96]|uniref:hypothetical protein n=1 Tax=Pseudomonas sp. HR96 TaxID=1027966 RepID=UPI002A75155D|nr:hypothetical protein [Pseudomonas sp. HR96]WPP01258.1 hypothetical protein SFA35_07835 [Pseudomonas sp. HR96]
MCKLPCPFLLLNLLCGWLVAAGAQAYTVQRCEAPDGHLTFTDLACAEHDSLSFQPAYSPPLGNAGRMLPERSHRPPVAAHRAIGAKVVVVGQTNPSASFRSGEPPGRAKRKNTRHPRYSAAE